MNITNSNAVLTLTDGDRGRRRARYGAGGGLSSTTGLLLTAISRNVSTIIEPASPHGASLCRRLIQPTPVLTPWAARTTPLTPSPLAGAAASKARTGSNATRKPMPQAVHPFSHHQRRWEKPTSIGVAN